MSSLLPPNRSAFERSIESTQERLDTLPVKVVDTWSPDNCPAELLPWLAWALSVDTWDGTWTESQRRDTIRNSIKVHQQKGTFGAIKAALNALGLPIKVQEWYQQDPPGKPYTFRLLLDVAQVGIPSTGALKFLPVVLASKNLRSHLETIQLQVTSRNTGYVGIYAKVGNELTVSPGDEMYAPLFPGLEVLDAGLDQSINVGFPSALGLK